MERSRYSRHGRARLLTRTSNGRMTRPYGAVPSRSARVRGHSLVFARLNRFVADSFGVALDQRVTYSDQLSAAVAAAEPIG
jgi:hypothetical protein